MNWMMKWMMYWMARREYKRMIDRAIRIGLTDRDRLRLIVVTAKMQDANDALLSVKARRAIENWRRT